MKRKLLVAASALAVLSVGGLGAGAWYVSDIALVPNHPETIAYPEVVLGVTEGTVTVTASAATTRPGTWSLNWSSGSAMVGDIVRRSAGRVERVRVSGQTPPTGIRASMYMTYSGDPKTALGLDFTEVMVPTELGDAPAWYVPARGDTWAITVHGANAHRNSSLHAIATMHRVGMPVLDITYRNDLGAPASPDGFLHQGESEWRDLEAATGKARSMGARHIVLYGASMGGAIVGRFLTRSPLADVVSAVVLENPEISSRRTGEFAAARMHLPSFVVPITEKVIDWRGGFDIAAIDLLGHPPRVKPPTLLLMGDADQEHPVETARELARSSGAMNWPIQYEEFPGAGHSEIWSTDRGRYDRTLAAFLTRTAPGPRRTGHPG
ncbi:alpha/beta hydrolase family protein [Microbispora amethystogenes]|uniref:Alpha/beta hydrolase n=1 Tax=Microbispora amethystogenes TaxID=1427754 RepID=A0ABQ4FIK6_9ACTN|nr:prolyl oligopeptidase family serine peptidase [Microbispora amethystogenes]GIH34664.1 alpha/beta hydrolase [Microbispora amethystogenes]